MRAWAVGCAVLLLLACAKSPEDDGTGGNSSGPASGGSGASGGASGGGGAGASGGASGGGGAGADGGSSSGGSGGDGGAGGGPGGAGQGGSGGGMGGQGGGGDVTPPMVLSTTPTDTSSAIGAATTIAVTFDEPMDATSITADSTTTCTGSIRLSLDNFASCVPMTGAPSTVDDTTFTLTPIAPLDSATTYRIRVTTQARDQALNALGATFSSPTGFTVRYARTVVIDGVNDFGAENMVTSSTVGGTLFLSYDDTHVYVGLEHPDLVVGGIGNKFVYFLFSTDTALATGNVLSSDGKAKFGAAGTARMSHHWKVRVDGAAYEEFLIGNGVDWSTNWGPQGKLTARAAGYVEGSVALSELNNPSSLAVTAYTIDYTGDGGNGWLYNMVFGATDGSGASPRDLFSYGLVTLPTSDVPNTLSHLVQY